MAEKRTEDLIGCKGEEGKGKQEPEERSGLKRINEVLDEPDDLQAERGGLKVKYSDFETK